MSYVVSGSMWSDKLRKAAITGGVAYMAGTFFGEQGQTQLGGFTISLPTALAATTAVGSVAADVSHDYILPYIPGNDRFANPESAILGLGVAGGASAYLLNEGNVLNGPGLNTFMLGAGSYAAGEWIDGKFFRQGGVASLGYF